MLDFTHHSPKGSSMRRFLLASLVLVGAALAPAQITYPLGKGMPDIGLKDPTGMFGTFDTLYVDASTTFRYGKAGQSDSAFREMQGGFLDPWIIDTVAKTATVEDQGVLVRLDSSGFSVGMNGTYTYSTGATSQATIRYGYTPQGARAIDVYGFVLRGKTDSMASKDTVRWVWTHPGCADAYQGLERWAWEVDAEGRCSTGVRSSRYSGDWSEEESMHLRWRDGRVVRAWTQLGTDTIEIEEWNWDGEGRLASLTGRRGDSTRGSAVQTFQYEEGVMVASRLVRGGSDALQSLVATMTTIRPANLGLRASSPRQAPVTARRDGAVLRFSNTGSEAVEIQVSTVRGERVGVLRLDVGREAMLPVTSTSAMLVWSAKGRSASARGTVVPGR